MTKQTQIGNPLSLLVEGKELDLLVEKFNNQFFSEPPAGSEPPVDPTPPATPPTDPAQPATPPADSAPPSADTKTFTQEDVNAIAAREAKKAQESMLKKLGIEDFNGAKDGLEQFRQWQESQKTEAQKQADALEKMKSDYESLQNNYNKATAETAALKQNIKTDSLDDVIVLANNLVSDEVTIEDAIKKVAEKYPHFKNDHVEVASEPERKKPNFSQGQNSNQQPTETDAWLSAFKF